MDRERKLIKNTLILGIGSILPKIASFLIIPILTALLTKEEYGTYDLITITVSLVLPTTTLQIQTAAFRFLIDARDDEKSVREIITNIYAFIMPVSLATLLTGYWFLPGSSLIRLLVLAYLFSDMLVNTSRQVARGLERNIIFAGNSILQHLLILLFTVLFVWYSRLKLPGAILSLAIASVIALLHIIIRLRLMNYLSIKVIRWHNIRRMLAYSWPMIPNTISMWVITVSDRIVVSMFMGVAANAVYAAANKLPSILTIAQSTFTMAWQENASIASKDKDAKSYYSAMFRRVFDFMAGALGLIICATPSLYVFIIKGDYHEAYAQIPILFLGMFFFSISSFLGGIYVAYKDTKSVGITTTVAAVVNLIVNISLIRYIGLYAASGSTLISFLFLMIYRMLDIRKLVRLQYETRHMLAVVGILILESVFCLYNTPLVNGFNCLVGGVVFFLINKDLLIMVFNRIRFFHA